MDQISEPPPLIHVRGLAKDYIMGAGNVVHALAGVSLAIPTGARFQFRNIGDDPLCFVIATMPPWPGDDEAVRAVDRWPVEV